MNVLSYLKHNCRRTLCENEFALNVPLSMMQDTNMRGRSFQKRCNIQRGAPLSERHYSFRGIAWLVTRVTTKVSSRASWRLFKVVAFHSVHANRKIRDVGSKKICGARDKCVFFLPVIQRQKSTLWYFATKSKSGTKSMSGLFFWCENCKCAARSPKISRSPPNHV